MTTLNRAHSELAQRSTHPGDGWWTHADTDARPRAGLNGWRELAEGAWHRSAHSGLSKVTEIRGHDPSPGPCLSLARLAGRTSSRAESSRCERNRRRPRAVVVRSHRHGRRGSRASTAAELDASAHYRDISAIIRSDGWRSGYGGARGHGTLARG